MKLSTLVSISYLAGSALAWPGMKGSMGAFRQTLAKRQDDDAFDSTEMIGDLRPEYNGGAGGPKTAVGTAVSNILLGTEDPQSTQRWTGILYNLGSKKCKADTCCVWRHIALDMERRFRGKSGRCNGPARAAVRLGFHDAGTWSKFTDDYGGADGSILLSGLAGNEAELSRGENRGLERIAGIMTNWYQKYKPYGVGMADLIQMGANVAAVTCPLGPRTRSFVGRIDSNKPAVNDLLPSVFAEADPLIELFENKTIRPHGLTALLGAHTTSQQHFVDTTRAGDPQDSTPGVWDVKFYSETLGGAPKRVFSFPSDVKLSTHPKISTEWNEFAGEQEHWNEDYAKEYVRLSLLGVNNINQLTECSHVLPPRTERLRLFDDDKIIKQWLAKKGGKKTSDNIEEGENVNTLEKS